MTGYVPLSATDLFIASLLVLISGGVSLAFKLRLEKTLALSVLRMMVQLLAIAAVLKFIFAQTSPLSALLVVAVIAVAATLEVALRQEFRFRSARSLLLSSSTAFLAGLAATLLAFAVLQPAAWYTPRILVPVLGMMVGTALSAAALTIDAMTYAAHRERNALEARLALGQPRLTAFSTILIRSLATGLMPTLIMLATAGLVTLPGMMTGQILAGVAPVEAAKYQILLMLFMAGAAALAALAAGFIAVTLLTDDRHRLRLDRTVHGGATDRQRAWRLTFKKKP